MDVYEPQNFYELKLHPGQVDINYSNATGGAKAQTNYDSQYRSSYPPKNTPDAMRQTITALQNVTAQANAKRCPKETVGKAIITGGIANVAARNCRREKEAKVNALSGIINEYESIHQNLVYGQQTLKDQAAADQAANTPLLDLEPTQAGMFPTGGGGNKILYIVIAVAGAAIIGYFALRK
jgi:hypothetical protein